MTTMIKGNVAADDKRSIYTLTRARGISFQDCEEGTEIEVAQWGTYTDTDKDGHEVTVLAVIDTEHQKYECISKTFREEFEYIADLMEDEVFSIKVVKGVARSGRKFITCELV